MKKEDVKEGVNIFDRWLKNFGTGTIVDVKKTVFTVRYSDMQLKYNYSNAQYLDKI